MPGTEGGVLVRFTAGVVIVGGIGFALVRFFGEVPPGRNLEAAVGAAAFGAVIASPGVLALLSSYGRPALLLPAAVVLVPLSFLSFALVTLPLLIPAVLLLRSYGGRSSAGTGTGTGAGRDALTTGLVVVLLLAALVALLSHDDPREYVTATATYGTSDVVTYREAALSLALTGAAVGAGWRLSRHQPRSG